MNKRQKIALSDRINMGQTSFAPALRLLHLTSRYLIERK